ncbi:MAG: hypothetical protein JW891_16825 [Candidatus Lokiarchaeota archaeon]|nr:hypothetical protein [Candidatus Lokiarchaeota archaeon]
MVDKINLQPNFTKELEYYYKVLHLSNYQKKIIKEFSKILSEYLPLSDAAIRGLFWRVLADYQVVHKEDLNEERKKGNVTPAIRIEGLKMILSLIRNKLKGILTDPKQEPLLDEAFEKVLNYYIENYTKE